jgi:uncharacterized protein YqeY
MRTRLRRALPPAMKARDQQTVAALRSALAAIDNAEAVEVTSTPPPAQPGPPPEREGEAVGAPERAAPVAGAGPAPGATPVAEAGPIAGAVTGLGAGEVERRSLTAAEMEAIVQREVAERRTAARAYKDAGQSRYAERLQADADLLSSYLRDPDPSA